MSVNGRMRRKGNGLDMTDIRMKRGTPRPSPLIHGANNKGEVK